MALDRILFWTRISAILLAIVLIFQGLRILFVSPPVKRSSIKQLQRLAEPVEVAETATPDHNDNSESESQSGRGGGGRRGGGGGSNPHEEKIAKLLSELPDSFQGQQNTIRNAQTLGQIPRKQPPSLQAVLGDVAIISISGQTVPIKLEEEKNGVKLLEIAANRALILYQGKTNEITMFSGIGSDSIMNN